MKTVQKALKKHGKNVGFRCRNVDKFFPISSIFFDTFSPHFSKSFAQLIHRVIHRIFHNKVTMNFVEKYLPLQDPIYNCFGRGYKL